MAVRPEPYLFTVEEYHRMGEAGILGEDDRVELINGEIVKMTPIGSRHSGCVDRLNQLLVEQVRRRAIVHPQNPVECNDFSEPQPDLALLAPRSDFYSGAHPRPEDVLLLIEVADSSLHYDRGVKAALYAATGVAEVWIVDLEHRQVEIFRSPGPAGYAEITTISSGAPAAHVAPIAFPDVMLTIEDIIGTDPSIA